MIIQLFKSGDSMRVRAVKIMRGYERPTGIRIEFYREGVLQSRSLSEFDFTLTLDQASELSFELESILQDITRQEDEENV